MHPALTSLRALDPGDRDHVAALFDRLSPRSRYLRYLAPVPSLPEQSLRRLLAIDHHQHEALGAFDGGDLVGAAHYFRSVGDPGHAEISVEVADSHQRRGIGARLLRELARLARGRGIGVFTALSLSQNLAVPALLDRLGWPARLELAGREVSLTLTLPA